MTRSRVPHESTSNVASKVPSLPIENITLGLNNVTLNYSWVNIQWRLMSLLQMWHLKYQPYQLRACLLFRNIITIITNFHSFSKFFTVAVNQFDQFLFRGNSHILSIFIAWIIVTLRRTIFISSVRSLVRLWTVGEVCPTSPQLWQVRNPHVLEGLSLCLRKEGWKVLLRFVTRIIWVIVLTPFGIKVLCWSNL